MKRIIYLISISFISIFIFTGYNISNGINLIDENPKSECPYLQNMDNVTCPYLEGKIKDSKSSCPFISGEAECPYTGRDANSGSCPYLENNGELKKIYKSIKNSST